MATESASTRTQLSSSPNWYKRFFAWTLANHQAEYEKAIAAQKQTLFGNLHGNILEIGPGTGVNLPYYAKEVHWIGIEPNPFMHSYLREAADKLGLNVDLRLGTAEQLEAEDNSIDAVVTTLVLCSVPNLIETLQEILRVLKPGGHFAFIEHVAAPQGTLLRQVQQGVQPLWKIIGDGCCPARETWVAVENAGFAHLDYQHFSGPVPIPIVKPHIMGVAIK
jgi:ubiquinone/menaquinone biosynthesis C-methylase UbiE